MATEPTAGPVSKADWRRSLRAARARRTPTERVAVAAGLGDVLTDALADGRLQAAETVAAFLPLGAEPDTRPLLRALVARGCRVLLPILYDDLDLGWGMVHDPADLDQLVVGRRGLRQPTVDLGRNVIGAAGLVLCPALAVDRAGTRLGQGGGSYDRALCRVAGGAPVVAVVHSDELLDQPLPRAMHDVPVDWALTELRLVRLGAGR